MTEEKSVGSKELNEFTSAVEGARSIRTSLHTVEEDTRKDISDKASKSVEQIGYDYGVEKNIFDPAILKKVGMGPNDLSPSDARKYAQFKERELHEEAADKIKGGLEKLIAAIPDESIEKVLRDDKVDEAIGSGAGKSYAGWKRLYDEYAQAQELLVRAKSKNLRPEDAQALRGHSAIAARDEAMKENAHRSIVLQRMIGQVVQEKVLQGYRGKDTEIKGAEQLIKEKEENLRKYEAKEHKDVKSYFTAGMSKLAKGSTDQYNMARDILYSTAIIK